MIRNLFLIILTSTFCFAPGFPANADSLDATECPGSLSKGDFSVAKVVSKKPSEFYSEVVNCPDISTRCVLGAVAQPGEVVLVNKSLGPWACAVLSTDTNLTWGWLRRQDLNFDLIRINFNPPKTLWKKDWEMISVVPGKVNQLHISTKDGRLVINGSSYMELRNSLGEFIHSERDLTGSSEPKGNILAISDGTTPCGVQVRLLGHMCW